MTQSSSRSKEQTKRQQQHPLFSQNLLRTSYVSLLPPPPTTIPFKIIFNNRMQNRLSIILSTPGIKQPSAPRARRALDFIPSRQVIRNVMSTHEKRRKNSLEKSTFYRFSFLLARFPRAIVINLNHQPREPTRTDSTTPSMLLQKGEEERRARISWFLIQKGLFFTMNFFTWKNSRKELEKNWNRWSVILLRIDRKDRTLFLDGPSFSLLLPFLFFFVINLAWDRSRIILARHTSRVVMGSGSNLSSSQTPPPPRHDWKLITLNPVSSSNRFVPGIIADASNRVIVNIACEIERFKLSDEYYKSDPRLI